MRKGKLFIRNRLIVLVFLISLTGLALGLLVNSVSAVPIIITTKRDTLVVDNDSDNAADLGDVLRYTIIVTNSGTTDADNVMLNDTIDANTTLVPGSIRTTPIARNDSYASLGNVGISVPAGSGVLANDNDPDGGSVFVIAAAGATTNGGAFAIGADGSFAYLPPPGFEGADSFTYTIQDSDGNQDPATVFIVVNEVIWFIDNSQAGPGTGVMSNPFSSITNFNNIAADEEGDIIFIYETGSGVYTADIPLLNNQTVIGQGASASISSIAGFTVPPFSNALPSTGGSRPVLGNSFIGVRLQANNTLRGFDINNTPPGGAGIANVPQNVSFGTLTINDMAIGGNGRAILITGDGTLVVTLDSITATADANGLGLLGNTGTIDGALTVTGATTIFNTSNIGINIFNTTAALDFGNTSVTNTPANAINVVNSPSGSFTFDSLTVSSSNGAGLFANNGGTITVTGAGNTASASGGPAVSLTNTTIGPSGITFQSASANNATSGIVLNNTGSGSFTVTGTGTTDGSGGTIQNITNRGFEAINAANISLSNMNFTNATTANGVAPGTATCNTAEPAGNTNTGCNAPVYLENVTGVTLNNLTINGSAQNGINGNGVTNFSLTNSELSNIGNEDPENGIQFLNLLGNNTFNNVTINGSRTRNALIENVQGNSTIALTNSTINNAVGEDGFFVKGASRSGNNASITFNVTNSSFTHNHSVQLKAHAEEGSNVDVNITGNSFDGEPTVVGNVGIDLAAGDNATLTFDVTGTGGNPQTFQPIRSHAVNVFILGGGSGEGTISGNTILGSEVGAGVRAIAEVTTSGNPSLVINVSNNNISNVKGTGLAGIDIRSRQGVVAATGVANVQATVDNNAVGVTNTADANIQFYINSGNTLCAAVTNNAASGTPFFGDAFYVGNPVFGDTLGAGTAQLSGWTGNIDTTWNNNGNTPTNSAFLDGTISGACTPTAPVAAAPAKILESVVVAAPAGPVMVDEPAQTLRDSRAINPAVWQRIVEQPLAVSAPELVAVAESKDGRLAKPLLSGETINVSLGTLDPGQVVLITFDVTVDSTVLADSPQVCNQGLISGDNFADVLTSDPDVGVNAPTCTAVEVSFNVFLPYLASDLE